MAFESAGNLKVSRMKDFLGIRRRLRFDLIPFNWICVYLRTSADFVSGLTVGPRKGKKHREQTSVKCLRPQHEQAICPFSPLRATVRNKAYST